MFGAKGLSWEKNPRRLICRLCQRAQRLIARDGASVHDASLLAAVIAANVLGDETGPRSMRPRSMRPPTLHHDAHEELERRVHEARVRLADPRANPSPPRLLLR